MRGGTPPKIYPGDQFGRLTVIEYVFSNKGRWYRCSCSCEQNREYTVKARYLLSGTTKSCGCIRKEKAREKANKKPNYKHGYASKLTLQPEYRTWSSMKNRCYNQKGPNYSRYGGRGITVCEEWRSNFDNFLRDMGARPQGTTLDRIDNDLGYFKENCRWATNAEQSRNKSNSCYYYCPECGHNGTKLDFRPDLEYDPEVGGLVPKGELLTAP